MVEGDFAPEQAKTIVHPPTPGKLGWVEEIKGRPLIEQLVPYFDLMDERLFEMNKRILAS